MVLLQSKDKKKWHRRKLILLGILVIFLFYLFLPKLNFPPPEQEPKPEPQSHLRIIEGSVKAKGSLYESMVKKKIPMRWIDLIISKLTTHVDFNKIRGGTYHFIMDVKGELVKFLFEKSPTEVYEVEKSPEGYVAKQKEVPLQKYLVKVSGEIRSSLYEAMKEAGEQDSLTLAFAEILAWEIDFYQDLREGDRFQLVVEKIYKEEQFVQYGPIHAVEYQSGSKIIRGFHFQGGYYNEIGRSLKKPFLKAPLQFDRISSRFSYARRHPILGGVRPHYGVDYAAPAGTPVLAVADGTVVSVGWAGGFGKQVVLRHRNGYKTYYGHLSRYGPGIKYGVRVRQKQIIGYVGSTGLATGPHLDYRLSKDGKFLNPLKVLFPSGVSLQKKDLDKFYQKRDEMVVWLTTRTMDQMKLGEITSVKLK